MTSDCGPLSLHSIDWQLIPLFKKTKLHKLQVFCICTLIIIITQSLEKVSFLILTNDSVSKQAFAVTPNFSISPSSYLWIHNDNAEYFYKGRGRKYTRYLSCAPRSRSSHSGEKKKKTNTNQNQVLDISLLCIFLLTMGSIYVPSVALVRMESQ